MFFPNYFKSDFRDDYLKIHLVDRKSNNYHSSEAEVSVMESVKENLEMNKFNKLWEFYVRIPAIKFGTSVVSSL